MRNQQDDRVIPKLEVVDIEEGWELRANGSAQAWVWREGDLFLAQSMARQELFDCPLTAWAWAFSRVLDPQG